IFHPDRFQTGPPRLREEAERRMQDVNQAYHDIINGKINGSLPTANSTGWKPPPSRPPGPNVSAGRPPAGPATETRAANPNWEAAAKYRAQRAAQHRMAKEAWERSLPTGRAVARPKTIFHTGSTLRGLGLARESNNLHCRGCNSIQWLPDGWRESLDSVDYYCSGCGRRILAR
ncbi:MAG: hypothetical protein ACRDYC_13505, partial [Acidimicrobiales bacterium]